MKKLVYSVLLPFVAAITVSTGVGVSALTSVAKADPWGYHHWEFPTRCIRCTYYDCDCLVIIWG